MYSTSVITYVYFTAKWRTLYILLHTLHFTNGLNSYIRPCRFFECSSKPPPSNVHAMMNTGMAYMITRYNTVVTMANCKVYIYIINRTLTLAEIGSKLKSLLAFCSESYIVFFLACDKSSFTLKACTRVLSVLLAEQWKVKILNFTTLELPGRACFLVQGSILFLPLHTLQILSLNKILRQIKMPSFVPTDSLHGLLWKCVLNIVYCSLTYSVCVSYL